MYLNGTEVVRDNLPAGPLTAATFSSTGHRGRRGHLEAVHGAGNPLVAGDNVIAAEVHQDSKSDTRGVFDLELQADGRSARTGSDPHRPSRGQHANDRRRPRSPVSAPGRRRRDRHA